MPITIIGSERSPFVRICRMFMIQQNIPFDFEILDFVNDEQDAKTLATKTPINKVPILIDGDQKIFDSRVIMNYLSEKCGIPKRSVGEENLISVIYSCMDTSVILFLMKRDGYDLQKSGFFLSRQLSRIPNNLGYLLPWVKTLSPENSSDWNYASMSLYSYLYWANARQILNLGDYPEFQHFVTLFSGAAGVKEN
jgi:glutathione S-transferase